MTLVLRTLALFLFLSASGAGTLREAKADARDCPQLPAGFKYREFEDETGTHRYVIFIPRQYRADRPWPVALFLHGAGERGTDSRLLIAGTLAVALEQSAETPFIVVFPQCEDTTGQALRGWQADGPDAQRALKILKQVEQEYSVDPDHRILIGWSMGGYGAWSLAATYPELWSSVLILAGGAIQDQLSLDALARRKVPVWAISADGDPLIAPDRSRILIEQLNQAGGNGTFTLLDSNDHNVCRLVFASPRTFDWLLNPTPATIQSINWNDITPLPRRTRFYSECLVQSTLLPDSLSMRMGNAPLQRLSDQLTKAYSEEPIAGTLEDIHRTFGNGENRTEVHLSDLHYTCHVSQVLVRGISGGRLGLEFSLRPLELSIGSIAVDSKNHAARTGPTSIQIGIHSPALLKLEVQPVMNQGRLQLRLLRKEFQFHDGNWYIAPPVIREFRSPVFTADQLITGIVGSLYEGRNDLIQGLYDSLPEVLQKVEEQLQQREAPGLARILSPLPVLIPDLEISPSQVRTDDRGISLLYNFSVNSLGAAGTIPPAVPLQLMSRGDGTNLTIQIGLDAITAISQLTIDQKSAQVNVLDISEEKFARFADPDFMKQLLPEAGITDADSLRTVLRLVDPMVVVGQPSRADEAGEERPTLLLKTSAASLDLYRGEADHGTPSLYGRILFSLSQPLLIALPERPDDADAAITVRWSPDCQVQFLRAEGVHDLPAPVVDDALFQKSFEDAWRQWGEAHGTQRIPVVVSDSGGTEVRIQSLQVFERILQLELALLPVHSDISSSSK